MLERRTESNRNDKDLKENIFFSVENYHLNRKVGQQWSFFYSLNFFTYFLKTNRVKTVMNLNSDQFSLNKMVIKMSILLTTGTNGLKFP